MANISDVAKLANVSVATVSRYLNNSGYVGKKSRAQIEEAIKQLNYTPSEVARTLTTKQSDLIGLIIPDINNPFFPELARAVEDTAFRHGYTVILCNSDEDIEKEQHYIKTLSKKYVAGLILTTILDQDNYSNNLSIPIVALDRPLNVNIPTVTTDNEKGAKIGTQYLIENGVSNILCISGPKSVTSTNLRLKGFFKAVEGNNVEIHMVESKHDFQTAEQLTYETLQAHPEIDGIFAFSDASAIGALKAAHRLGLKVPEQLQIVGFDGIQMGNVVTPSLTTVAQDIYRLGERATQILIEQIEGKSTNSFSEQIEPQLLIRETTKERGPL
ncbi:LacI family DNA-binding transcriptional regulator [Lysinibacillus endophyticus]|uniref:LacI family DNA-binding transcriptional regulator n=1 Tax=Ureibacillus endophyticus TaxID=1978490 RepID=UPI003135A5F0